MISASLKNADCIIVFVRPFSPISLANLVAFMIKNFALRWARIFFTLFGIFSMVFLASQIEFSRKTPPSFIPPTTS